MNGNHKAFSPEQDYNHVHAVSLNQNCLSASKLKRNQNNVIRNEEQEGLTDNCDEA